MIDLPLIGSWLQKWLNVACEQAKRKSS